MRMPHFALALLLGAASTAAGPITLKLVNPDPVPEPQREPARVLEPPKRTHSHAREKARRLRQMEEAAAKAAAKAARS